MSKDFVSMWFFKFIFIYLLLVIKAYPQAFHDIEAINVENEDERVGKVKGDLSSESGAEDLFEYSFGSTFGVNTFQDEQLETSLSFAIALSKSERDENTFKEEVESSAKWVSYFSNLLAYELFLDYYRDPFQEIEHRYQAGLGLRTRLIDDSEKLFIIGAGFLIEEEEFDNGIRESIERFRFYSIYKKEVFDRSTFSLSIVYFPEIKFDDSRIVGHLSLKTPLGKELSLIISTLYMNDKNPVEGVEKDVRESKFSFEWLFF